MSDLNKVVDLFMQENDEKALKELYKITNDGIVKILLDWKEEYEVELESADTYVSSMYADVISYIWSKYKLNEVSKEENIDMDIDMDIQS